MRVILKGFSLLALFFALLLAFQQINWMKIFEVEDNKRKMEEGLGELFWDIFKNKEKEVSNPEVYDAVDSLLTHLCKKNNIDRDQIKFHLLEKAEVNAFALPDGHLVVFTGLIDQAENQEELCGVIGHELAHIQLNHVMKKLVKEVGLSMLISMTTGRSGNDAISQAAKTLSSTAFDRSLEKEADMKAVDYMIKSDINPEPFADFLYRLSMEDPKMMKYLEWISTHPESENRSKNILDYCRDKTYKKEAVLSESAWNKLKSQVNISSEDSI